jgi:hypothetical protein
VGWLNDRKSFTAPLANVDEASRWNLQDVSSIHAFTHSLRAFCIRVNDCVVRLLNNHIDANQIPWHRLSFT